MTLIELKYYNTLMQMLQTGKWRRTVIILMHFCTHHFPLALLSYRAIVAEKDAVIDFIGNTRRGGLGAAGSRESLFSGVLVAAKPPQAPHQEDFEGLRPSSSLFPIKSNTMLIT